jgi:GT2 family glycosyltransferase
MREVSSVRMRPHPHGNVSVVIPNWNGLDFLRIVLPSLEAQTDQDFTVTVVDNGSEDESVDWLRREWPLVNVIELPENLGFAPAVNAGIRATTAEFVALLNNDLELEPRWLEEMVATLRAHPGAGSAGGKMLRYDRRDLIDDAGNGFSWYGVGFAHGKGERDNGRFDQPATVFSACAGAALYRRTALDQVGLMDEDFFAYAEDLDWGFRAWLAGYSCWYQPAAVSYHIGGATSARAGDLARFLTFRNSLELVMKDFPGRALARHAHRLMLFVLGTLATSAAARSTAELRALASALRRCGRTLRKRRAVQRSRRARLADLDAVIVDYYPTQRSLFRFVDDRLVRSRGGENARTPGAGLP